MLREHPLNHPAPFPVTVDSRRWLILIALIGGIVAVFAARTLMASSFRMPRLFEIFEALTLFGSIVVVLRGLAFLKRADWFISVAIGLVIAIEMQSATLFNPYPIWDRWDGPVIQGVGRGGLTAVAALGGIVIMRRGGPVLLRMAAGQWGKAAWGLCLGAVVGIPLAILNLFANSMVQGKTFVWQNPLAAGMDAVQPGIFEEVIYRFALLGILWLILHKEFPRQATWLAGALAIAVHSYSHYTELFVTAPLMAVAMGTVLGIVWGVPLTILAIRRDLESAVGFHWMQDALRFYGGL